MGTTYKLLGGNPSMGQHPIQGGVAILLGILHAKETEISFGCLSLWLVCTFTPHPLHWQETIPTFLCIKTPTRALGWQNTEFVIDFVSLCVLTTTEWEKRCTTFYTVTKHFGRLSCILINYIFITIIILIHFILRFIYTITIGSSALDLPIHWHYWLL